MLHFQQKPLALPRGPNIQRCTSCDTMRHILLSGRWAQLLVREQCHVELHQKLCRMASRDRGVRGTISFLKGIARLLLEVLKCCIQRNWSRDLRQAQKKSGNAKLSMVLVYTSSKAVKKVASKKRYQAWNGYRESMDNKLSRQNWELMTCKFGISSSTWLFSGSMSILGWRRLETQKLWWVKHVEALRQKLLWR